MKSIREYGFMIDDRPILAKLNKDGEIMENDEGEIIEVPDTKKLTYGDVKDLIEQLIDNIKQDLRDLAEMIDD
jgi:hypothetical protein